MGRLQKQFGTHSFTPLLFDVTDEKAVHKAAGTVRSTLNGRRLTALINNAGIGQIEPTAVANIERARKVVDTNLIGYLICTQAFLPLLGTDKSLSGTVIFQAWVEDFNSPCMLALSCHLRISVLLVSGLV